MKRLRGVRLGRPRAVPDEVPAKAVAMRKAGASLRQIADVFNGNNVATGHGGRRWYSSTIVALLGSAERELD